MTIGDNGLSIRNPQNLFQPSKYWLLTQTKTNHLNTQMFTEANNNLRQALCFADIQVQKCMITMQLTV